MVDFLDEKKFDVEAGDGYGQAGVRQKRRI